MAKDVLLKERVYLISISLSEGEDQQLSRMSVLNSVENFIAYLVVKELATLPKNQDQVDLSFFAVRVHLHTVQE